VLVAAADALLAGGIAILPAEGLYGLHADGSHREALALIRALKGSPAGRGFIVLLGSPDQVGAYASGLPGVAAELIREAWPGPLTLILPAADTLPPELRPDGNVAVRCPGISLLREIALLLPGPLISTSANRSGEIPPQRLEKIEAEIVSACALAVDGGVLAGEASTVVRPEPGGGLTILRQGLWRP
jgi:L-threonylcarbamoyladenylate synthase